MASQSWKTFKNLYMNGPGNAGVVADTDNIPQQEIETAAHDSSAFSDADSHIETTCKMTFHLFMASKPPSTSNKCQGCISHEHTTCISTILQTPNLHHILFTTHAACDD